MKKQAGKTDKISELILLVLGLLVVVLLVNSLEKLELHPGEKAVFSTESKTVSIQPDSPIKEEISEVSPPVWILYFFLIPFLIVAVRGLRKIEWSSPRDMDWAPLFLILIIGLAVIALLAFSIQFMNSSGLNLITPSNFREPDLIFDPSFQNYLARWFVFVMALFLTFLGFGTFWLLMRVRQNRLGNKSVAEFIGAEIRQAALEISAGKSTKDTIILCYQNMCLLLSDQKSLEREGSMTAQEFITHLQQLNFNTDNMVQLTCLFEKARYSDDANTEEDKREAVTCLQAIIGQNSGI